MPDIGEYFPGIKEGFVTLGNIQVVDLGDILDANGNEILEFDTVASAINNIGVKNAATGNNPILYAAGEADTGMNIENSEGEEGLIIDFNATAVNELTIDNAATGSPVILSATGGDANIDLQLLAKGTGSIDASTDGIRTIQSIDNVNDTTPTNGELDTAFGSSTGRGFIGTIDDNDADTVGYIVWSTDASWFWLKGTKAT